MEDNTKKIAIGAAAVGVLGFGAYKFFGGKRHHEAATSSAAAPAAKAPASAGAPASPSLPEASSTTETTVDDLPDTDSSPILQVEELEIPNHYRIHLRSGLVREVVRHVRPRIHERWPLVDEVDGQEAFGIIRPIHVEPAMDIFNRHPEHIVERHEERRERAGRERHEERRDERVERAGRR